MSRARLRRVASAGAIILARWLWQVTWRLGRRTAIAIAVAMALLTGPVGTLAVSPVLAQSSQACDLIGGQGAPSDVTVFTVGPNGVFYAGNAGGAVWSWNGTSWSGNGVIPMPAQSLFPALTSLAWFDGALYAGVDAGGYGPGLYVWTGSTWAAVPGLPTLASRPAGDPCGYDTLVYALFPYGGQLYVATSAGLWEWNGATFTPVPGTPNVSPSGITCQSGVTSLSLVGGTLLAGEPEMIMAVSGSQLIQAYPK